MIPPATYINMDENRRGKKINRWKLFQQFFCSQLFLSPIDDTFDFDWSKGKKECCWKAKSRHQGIVYGIKIDDMLMATRRKRFLFDGPPIKHYKWNKKGTKQQTNMKSTAVEPNRSCRQIVCIHPLILAMDDIENYVNHSMLHTISMFISVESWLVFLLRGHYKLKRNYLCLCFLCFFRSLSHRIFREEEGDGEMEENIPQIGTTWDDSILPQLVQSRSLDRFHFICWRNLNRFLAAYFERNEKNIENIFGNINRLHLRAIVSKLETLFSRSVSLLISLTPCVLLFYVHGWRVHT